MCVANFLFEQQVDYTHRLGNKNSYIDHIFIPKYLCNKVTECNILHEAKDNVSDHLALGATVIIPTYNQEPGECDKIIHGPGYPKTNWSDPTFIHNYKQNIKYMMDNIPVTDINRVNRTSASFIVNHSMTKYVWLSMNVLKFVNRMLDLVESPRSGGTLNAL